MLILLIKIPPVNYFCLSRVDKNQLVTLLYCAMPLALLDGKYVLITFTLIKVSQEI